MSTLPDHPATDRHLVFVSQAAADHSPATFASICRRARAHNAAAGIGGVLLYDGEQFGQWLYGPAPAVTALMQRIAVDERHHAVTVLFDGPDREGACGAHGTHGAPQVWRSGYAQPDALTLLAARAAAPPVDVLREFRSLIATADLWPPID